VHAAPGSFWSVFPTVIFEIGTDIFSTDLELVKVWSQSTDFKLVLWAVFDQFEIGHFWSNTPQPIADWSPPDCLIFFQQIPDWSGGLGWTNFKTARDDRFQIGQIGELTDFKLVNPRTP